ncbi:hypothetical protein BRPE67_CCDS06750 [Caballeronia cordobensis]|nr:hypothetical protein BRPE67_CCDS06750 [Burkholderia sp. RPE67]
MNGAMQADTPPPEFSAPSDIAETAYAYANYFEAGFSHEEILLRIAQAFDGKQECGDGIRIVMTPTYARALLELLRSTLARFEAVHEALGHTGADAPPPDDPEY